MTAAWVTSSVATQRPCGCVVRVGCCQDRLHMPWWCQARYRRRHTYTVCCMSFPHPTHRNRMSDAAAAGRARASLCVLLALQLQSDAGA